MFPCALAPTDIYKLYDHTNFPGYADTTGRTTATLTSIGATEACFIVWGQSLDANHGNAAHTPTNTTKVLQVNPNSGTVYQLKDPVLGASSTGGSWMSYLGDELVNAGIFTKVCFIPVAIGGTGTAEWISSGLQHHRLRSAILRARQLGFIGATTAMLGNPGQSDAGLTANQYLANFTSIKASAAAYGYSGKWFVSQNTINNGPADTVIRAGQASCVDNVTVFAGPDYDTLTGGTNRYDGIHMTAAGNAALAVLWKTALDAVF